MVDHIDISRRPANGAAIADAGKQQFHIGGKIRRTSPIEAEHLGAEVVQNADCVACAQHSLRQVRADKSGLRLPRRHS